VPDNAASAISETAFISGILFFDFASLLSPGILNEQRAMFRHSTR